MNLIIDQGNSTTKVAVFGDSGMVYSRVLSNDWEPVVIDAILDRYAVDAAIFSSVAAPSAYSSRVADVRKRIPGLLFFDHRTLLPLKISYLTPETLGRDRIAGVVGAMGERPGQNLLVIDAGTAVTYDVLLNGDTFIGGNISLGLYSRLRALHEFTGCLPLVSVSGDVPLVGYDTETAIRSGVLSGLIAEMDNYIEQVRNTYPKVFIFLTGGDTILFATKLKNAIFADKNLVLKGLNRILDYNVKK